MIAVLKPDAAREFEDILSRYRAGRMTQAEWEGHCRETPGFWAWVRQSWPEAKQ